jgi:DNA-binding LytR/AlgR family response regulator
MKQNLISVAICDDEMLTCLDIKKRMQNIFLKKGVNHNIQTFCSGKELIDSKSKFDIILLDIKMDALNGIETAKKLRENNCSSILIFITSAPEYVYYAFDVEAFHYILKPIDNTKLTDILCNAINKVLQSKNEFIIIQANRQNIKIELSEIIYFEITGRVIKAHSNEAIYEFYEKLSVLEQKLPNDEFFRCHKSYLINLSYVTSFEKNEITLNNTEKIPLSKLRYDVFSKIFLTFIKKEGGIL